MVGGVVRLAAGKQDLHCGRQQPGTVHRIAGLAEQSLDSGDGGPGAALRQP